MAMLLSRLRTLSLSPLILQTMALHLSIFLLNKDDINKIDQKQKRYHEFSKNRKLTSDFTFFESAVICLSLSDKTLASTSLRPATIDTR